MAATKEISCGFKSFFGADLGDIPEVGAVFELGLASISEDVHIVVCDFGTAVFFDVVLYPLKDYILSRACNTKATSCSGSSEN